MHMHKNCMRIHSYIYIYTYYIRIYIYICLYIMYICAYVHKSWCLFCGTASHSQWDTSPSVYSLQSAWRHSGPRTTEKVSVEAMTPPASQAAKIIVREKVIFNNQWKSKPTKCTACKIIALLRERRDAFDNTSARGSMVSKGDKVERHPNVLKELTQFFVNVYCLD